jgi:cell division septation protein DedD
MRYIFFKKVSIVLLFGSSLLFSETMGEVTQSSDKVKEKNLKLYYSEVYNEKDDPYAIEPLKTDAKSETYDEKDDPYAVKPLTKPNQKKIKSKKSDAPQKNIKLQVGAFSSKENADKFVKHEREDGAKMQVLDIYSKNVDKRLYKVVIRCDSMQEVEAIRKSKKYAGAFVLK